MGISMLSPTNIVDTKGRCVLVNSEANEKCLNNHSFISILSPFVPSDISYIDNVDTVEVKDDEKLDKPDIVDTEKSFIDLSLEKDKKKKKKKKKAPKYIPPSLLKKIIA